MNREAMKKELYIAAVSQYLGIAVNELTPDIAAKIADLYDDRYSIWGAVLYMQKFLHVKPS